MSKIFYDHLVVLENVEREIKVLTNSPEERDELWQIVDELVHGRALGLILDKLPRQHHEEFLEKFQKAPYDEGLLKYLEQKIDKNIEELLRQELGNLAFEILQEIKSQKK